MEVAETTTTGESLDDKSDETAAQRFARDFHVVIEGQLPAVSREFATTPLVRIGKGRGAAMADLRIVVEDGSHDLRIIDDDGEIVGAFDGVDLEATTITFDANGDDEVEGLIDVLVAGEKLKPLAARLRQRSR